MATLIKTTIMNNIKKTQKEKHDAFISFMKAVQKLGADHGCLVKTDVTVPDEPFEKDQPLGIVLGITAEFTPGRDMWRATPLTHADMKGE